MQKPILVLLAALALVVGCGPGTPPAATLIRVPAGGDLQAALDAATPGSTIELPIDASFVGNFVLPAKVGDAWITVRSAASENQPEPGQRAWVSDAVAHIRTPNTAPAIATAPGAHHWRLELLEIMQTVAGVGDLITLGDGSAAQTTLATVAHDLVLDRVQVTAEPGLSMKRGVALNSAATTIMNSRIAGMKLVGDDSQAIAGWNGPGPYVLTNNYLEAAGECVMFGGDDPKIPHLSPSDITFTGNHVARPLAWRGSPWAIKNLFELKHARRVLVEGNLFEHHWAESQAGSAIVFTPRNQGGGCPWCVVDDVVFSRNIVRDVDAGMNLAGLDDLQVSQPTTGIVIRDNLFDRIAANWLLVQNGPIHGLVIERNTAHQGGNIMALGGAPSPGAIIRSNAVAHGSYGVHGDSRGSGTDSLEAYLPGFTFLLNAIVGEPFPHSYPAGNTFPEDWSGVSAGVGVDPAVLPDVAKIVSGR